MKTFREKTEIYLQEIEDAPIDFLLKSVPALPLVLRERYQLFTAKLFGRAWLLAMEAEGWEPGSPTEYRQHLHQLSQITGEDHIALVMQSISAKVRNRMVRMSVPFIVPNTQVYLPLAMINLRESFSASHRSEGKPLSPAAQVIFLIQVQQGGLENKSSKEISSRTKYSRASISTACAELERNHLCKTFREGKEQRMEFSRAPRDLWQVALPILKSPVRKTHWVKWDQPLPEARLAGISALSQLSSLADDRIPTFALQERDIREGFDNGRFHECADRHEADALLEAWSYDSRLSSLGETVDPLSLYLSLRKNPDERVQAELAAMIEDFPWR